MTETKNNLFATAFIKAQQEMGSALKDSANPFFKNKYANLTSVLAACLPALNKHGIGVMQPIVQIEGKHFVKTILLHESGESMDSLTEIIFNKQNDAQAQGSGITYARRYGLQSLVSIGAEDDDGNKVSEPRITASLARGANEEMREACTEQDERFDIIKTHLTNRGSIVELQAAWLDKEPEIRAKLNPTMQKQLERLKDKEKARITA